MELSQMASGETYIKTCVNVQQAVCGRLCIDLNAVVHATVQEHFVPCSPCF